jgi:hypothetical protein
LQNPFTDVAEGEWYADAVKWAAENGIVLGYGDGTYGPDNIITREQLAAIMYRYAVFTEIDVSINEDLLPNYADASDISEYAVTPLQWACGSGLITGKPNGILDPLGEATRAEFAAILTRYLSSIAEIE